ncbi:hypothetical protein HYPSUDRAFT_202327 [Hypholoma sublateritium FD-334 SS-4]|uniref:Uncharacterized protein n=1 Tax=Hypholoma sublateritium (strain FD-334 SS-4) TaxID=945553 RepID=A0A0D2L618_HYPSF|nr:hypothetical protein HYPSUDRAFT_202327 [Hypholoma sublateritium FD-334 SS-4]
MVRGTPLLVYNASPPVHDTGAQQNERRSTALIQKIRLFVTGAFPPPRTFSPAPPHRSFRFVPLFPTISKTR